MTGWWEPGAHQAKADTRTSGRREPATTTSEEGKALPVSPRQKCYEKKIISGDNRIREGKNLEISSPHWGGWVLVFNCNNMGGREIFFTPLHYQKELFSCYNTLRRRNNFIQEIFGTIEGQKLCDLKYSQQQQQMQDILTNFQGTIVENLCHLC